MPLNDPGSVISAITAIIGNERSRAHEMTCHPPRRRDKVAPSA